jgi:transposase-like protein
LATVSRTRGVIPTRKVEDLVAALGVASGISRIEASRICTELDRNLDASATGPSTMSSSVTAFADATYVKTGSTVASCPEPWSSPPASPPTVTERSSA